MPAATTAWGSGGSTAAPSFPADPEGHKEELWGVEDPRITWVEDQQQYYIAYTAYSAAGPLVSLASTTDFVSFTRWVR